MATIDVVLKIDIDRTAPDALVTASGQRYPLWAISEDDLRDVGAYIVATMIRRQAEQRAAAMITPDTGLIGGRK